MAIQFFFAIVGGKTRETRKAHGQLDRKQPKINPQATKKELMANAAREAIKNIRFPGGPGGFLGGTGALVGLGLAAYGVNASLYNVDGGHRAVKYSRFFGVLDTIYDEGTHFRIPWFEEPV
eukprot:Partr_v1_DN27272_c2_g1_i1_m38392 putative Prohibitin 2